MTYHTITDKAFVLSTFPRGENNRTVECFTQLYGRQRTIARSVRVEGARLRTSAIPYRYSQISFVVGRQNTLIDIQTISQFHFDTHIRMRAYVTLLDILSRFMPEDEPHQSVFDSVFETVCNIVSAQNEFECLCWKDACIEHMGIALGYIEQRHSSLKETVTQMVSSPPTRLKILSSLENMYSVSHL